MYFCRDQRLGIKPAFSVGVKLFQKTVFTKVFRDKNVRPGAKAN